MSNGRWQEFIPKCIEKTCYLDAGEYSKKMYNIFSSNQVTDTFVYPINTVVKVICGPGYELIGSAELTCNLDIQNGVWSERPPLCRLELSCPFVNPPENGLINTNKQSTSNGYSLNTTLEFSCLPGYKLHGSRIYVCISNGTHAVWKGETVSCMLDAHKPTTTTTQQTTTTTISLDKPDTSNQIGQDINENLIESCKIDQSSTLMAHSNLIPTVQSLNEYIFLNTTIGNFIQNGIAVAYQCRTSKLITHNAKCINGTLYMQQNCDDLGRGGKPCSTPPKIPYGYNKFGSSLHGSKALYQCFNGYELSKGHGELKCTNGEWVGSIPFCTKSINFFFVACTVIYEFAPKLFRIFNLGNG